jgi:hypothetical protein
MKLNIKAFTLASGFTWAAAWFIVAWWLILQEGPTGEITLIGRLYPGFRLSPLGSLFGLLWGFIDGCAMGGLLAVLYNRLAGEPGQG